MNNVCKLKIWEVGKGGNPSLVDHLIFTLTRPTHSVDSRINARALPPHTEAADLPGPEYDPVFFPRYGLKLTLKKKKSLQIRKNHQCSNINHMRLSLQSTAVVKLCPSQPRLPHQTDDIRLIRSDMRQG